ncbi:MAG: ROK family protein, partial [Euryarchaeota archaeon]|nr:ROK family protein [Euryarchaeota archaeon]
LVETLARTPGVRVRGVAVGMPGAVDPRRGVLYQSPNFAGSGDYPLRSELEARLRGLGVPVVVENDANAYAVGEHWKGAGRGAPSLVCLTLGTGVGGAVILWGRLWRGEQGAAGELGHMVVDPEGPGCSCGGRGCLEAYLGARSIRRRIQEVADRSGEPGRWGKSPGPRELQAAAEKGDLLALQVWDEIGRHLGIGLASLVNIFNPHTIVIGGGVAAGWDLFMPPARREMEARAFRIPARRVKLARARLGDDAGVLGAARLAWQSLPGAAGE